LLLGIAQPRPAQATGAEVCAACFASGCAVSCTITGTAQTSAFGVVQAAIALSEQIIFESTGYGALGATGMVGFPSVVSTISASEANQTGSLVTAIEAAATTIATEIRRAPVNRELYESATRQGAVVPSRARETCSALDLGSTFDIGGIRRTESVRGWIEDGAKLGGVANPIRVFPSVRDEDGNINPQAVQARLIGSASNERLANVLNAAIGPIRDKARNEGKSVTDYLSAAYWIDDNYRTIPRNPSDPLSSDQLSALVLQLLTASRPSTAEAQRAAATTTADLQSASVAEINDMRLSVPAAITERFLRLRNAHDAKLGAEDYMKQAMGEMDPNALNINPESDEGFMYLMANHRVRSSDWAARVAVNSPFDLCQDYATCQIVQTAAERLYTKYQTYLAKKDFNLALAQALATKLEYEKP